MFATLVLSAGAAPGSDFGGVGLQVVPTAGGELVVLRVLPESPAARQGIREGDLIMEVDGFELQGSEFAAVVRERLWGEPGTSVGLRYLRPGVAGVREAEIVRIPMAPDAPPAPGVRMLIPGQGD